MKEASENQVCRTLNGVGGGSDMTFVEVQLYYNCAELNLVIDFFQVVRSNLKT